MVESTVFNSEIQHCLLLRHAVIKSHQVSFIQLFILHTENNLSRLYKTVSASLERGAQISYGRHFRQTCKSVNDSRMPLDIARQRSLLPPTQYELADKSSLI